MALLRRRLAPLAGDRRRAGRPARRSCWSPSTTAFALDLGPLGLGWGAALAAGTGSGLYSTLLLGGVLAALAGTIRVLFARRRLARDETPSGAGIKTRGPVSYAGPGSLGGTESALRR